MPFHFWLDEQAVRMVGSVDLVQIAADAGGLQGIVEPLALLIGYLAVGQSMQ